ncbi:MAG: glycosyltransferase family 39 protein [Candidatus Coatesbacteria bacterium]|nr:glycosyltransferase family 39 protein [Candidatus Coatesbacteria bacterium]
MKDTAKNGAIFALFAIIALVIRLFYLIGASDSFIAKLIVCDSKFYLWRTSQILGGDIFPSEAFRLSPLYPYLLAIVFFFTGVTEPYIVKLLQAVLGSLSCGMTYLIAARLFGKRAGIAAGVLYLLSGPVLFTESLILLESSMCFFHLLFLFLLLLAFDRKSVILAGASGLTLGLTALLRGNILLYVPAIIVFAIWKPPEGRFKAIGRTLLPFLVGVGLPLMLCAAVNYSAEKDIVLLSSNAGYNFFVGNRPEASGVYDRITQFGDTAWFKVTDPDGRDFARAATGKELRPSEASRFWFHTTLESMKGRYFQTGLLFMKKVGLFFNRHELPQMYWYEVARESSRLLKLLPVTFVFLTPLGLFGIGLALRKGGIHRLFASFAILYVLSIAIFFVVARYRIPLVPLLLAFSGWTIDWWIERLRSFSFRRSIGPAIALAVLALPPYLPIQVHRPEAAFAAYATHCLSVGDVRNASLFAKRANEIAPEESYPIYILGKIALGEGDVQQAISYYQRAVEAKDPQAVYYSALASALRSRGDLSRALVALEKAIEMAPGNLQYLILKAEISAQKGDKEAALSALQKAVDANPDSAFALYSLGKLETVLGKQDLARAHLTEAARLRPDIASIREALNELGNSEESSMDSQN